MVLFAGPIFTEWYWGPIFFAIVFGPIVLSAAIVADLVLRRRLRSWHRVAMATGIIVGATLLIVGGRELIKDVRFDREATAVASRFAFTPYQPDPLPGPFIEEGVTADDNFNGPALISRYGAGAGGYATVYQQQPGAELALQNGRCSLRGLAGAGTSFFDGPCRELRSARSIPVFISVSQGINRNVFAMLDGTLVRLWVSAGVADRDVLAYFDSLQPVGKGDIEFKRG